MLFLENLEAVFKNGVSNIQKLGEVDKSYDVFKKKFKKQLDAELETLEKEEAKIRESIANYEGSKFKAYLKNIYPRAMIFIAKRRYKTKYWKKINTIKYSQISDYKLIKYMQEKGDGTK